MTNEYNNPFHCFPNITSSRVAHLSGFVAILPPFNFFIQEQIISLPNHNILHKFRLPFLVTNFLLCVLSENPDICMDFSICCYINTGISKKIDGVARKADCGNVGLWKKSISLHLYWCAASTPDGNGEVMKAKWEATMHHIQDQHTGFHNQLYTECSHPPLEAEDRNKLWLAPGKTT